MPAPPSWPSRRSASAARCASGDDEEAINRMFTPEFRNRLDAIISFAALSPETIGRVVDKFILQLEEQLADRNVTIELDDGARDWLAREGLRPAVRRAARWPASSRSTSRSRWPKSCCSATWPRAASSASPRSPTKTSSASRSKSAPSPRSNPRNRRWWSNQGGHRRAVAERRSLSGSRQRCRGIGRHGARSMWRRCQSA